MSSEGKFPFTAIDPQGMPRTGSVRAPTAAAASEKLRARGFSSIEVSPSGEARNQLELLNSAQRRPVERAPRRGYRASWGERLEDHASRLPTRLPQAAGLLILVGLLLSLYLWTSEPTAARTPPTIQEQPVNLTVTASLPSDLSGDRLMLEMPEIPYAWEQTLDGTTTLTKQFAFTTSKAPSYVRLRLYQAPSDRLILSQQRSLSPGASTVDFGLLTPRAD